MTTPDQSAVAKMASLITSVVFAKREAPPPPKYIPDNVCSTLCHICSRRWFEGTIAIFYCQCNQYRFCPECAFEHFEAVEMEHNLADCNYVAPDTDSDTDTASTTIASTGK